MSYEEYYELDRKTDAIAETKRSIQITSKIKISKSK